MRKCVLMQHLYARMQHLRANGLSERPEQRHHEYGNDERYDVKRQSDTHKIGKTVVAHTLHYQVGLVTNGGAETGRGSHADGYEKGHGTYVHVLRNAQRQRKGERGGSIVGHEFGKHIGDDKHHSKQHHRTAAVAQPYSKLRHEVGHARVLHGTAYGKGRGYGNEYVPRYEFGILAGRKYIEPGHDDCDNADKEEHVEHFQRGIL